MKALDWFHQRSFQLLHLLPFLCHEVAANTEIINFSSSREPTVDLPLNVVGNWSRLHPTDNERRWSLEPAALHTPLYQVCEQSNQSVASHTPFSCPHELWLLLDLDDEKWASYTTFTLRLSWPASAPADFSISLYSSQDILARLSERELISSGRIERTRTYAHTSSTPHTTTTITTITTTITTTTTTTRSRYARIRAVGAGVLTPSSRSHSLPALAPEPRVGIPHPDNDTPAKLVVVERGKGTVPLVVILEPAYLGVLPATLLPTVGFLVPVVVAAISFVPWVIAYFEPFVRQARKDMNGMTRANKER